LVSKVTDRTLPRTKTKSNWITARVGDVAKTQYGLSEGMNEDGKGYKTFRMGELQSGRLIDTGQMKYADISAAEFAQYKLKPNDVLFNRTNSFELVGKTGIFELDGDYCFASYLVRLKLDQRVVLPRFLNYLMNSVAFQTSIKRKASKSINQANINATILSDERICFPTSINEQQTIVALLDKAFSGIDAARDNTNRSLRDAEDLFLWHLANLFNEAYTSSPTVRLSELASSITDGDHMPPPKCENGIPFVTISNIDKRSHIVDFSDTFFVSRQYFESLKPHRRPRKGDLLYTVTGSFGIPVKIEDDSEFCFQRHIGLIRPKSDVSTSWLYYLVRSPQLFRQASERATGTAQKTVSLSVLRDFAVPKLSLSKQQAMVSKIDELKIETDRLEAVYVRKLSDLEELRQSLLNSAFSSDL
jgi:restriction endonuclease S subunit